MADIRQGRWTSRIEGDFVVLLIGARVDRRHPLRSMRDLGGFKWKRVGTSGRTGIWHETFLVRAGEYEAIYGNMPPFGLGRAGDLVPLREDATARKRLRKLAG